MHTKEAGVQARDCELFAGALGSLERELYGPAPDTTSTAPLGSLLVNQEVLRD